LLGEGLGAGGVPEIGRSEAEKNIDDIKRLLNDGTKMVFITASMGGGTGTGSAPVIAGVAKEMGMLTIGIITIPFYFEKKQKIIRALKGVEEMRKNVDALLIINNERLCDVYCDTPISVKESFARADNILKEAVVGISELITVNSDGGIDLDFRDVETTMRNGGGAIMAMGRAEGEKRVEHAIKNALDSPLLYGTDITRAKRILFNIYSSDDTPIMVPEMQEIDDFFDSLNPNIEVIWGISSDNTLGADAKVTILATGMEEIGNCQEEMKDDDYYEDLIRQLYRPIMKKEEAVESKPIFIVATPPDPEPSDLEPTAGPYTSYTERMKQWITKILKDTEE
jgi:cell division protein FtsZ